MKHLLIFNFFINKFALIYMHKHLKNSAIKRLCATVKGMLIRNQSVKLRISILKGSYYISCSIHGES